ncbi:hypothetical protein M404DRAFT_991955 [Pisolithus tinctorius Marx 270]|uniref:Uncharacterized protein n=1 Tax=Pisolithus tinctorius Marx 270 TaxID=870435 RepID=A0A0C3PZE2_PISTI|nr:hypothetical protein M404DRAFT_991955 [Pisolithus tinctorius Marx 270]
MSQQLGTLNISSVESKINTGRSKKDAGDAAFKSGDVKSGEYPLFVQWHLTWVH